MSATDDYCELCDLPTSQCVHGRPPPATKPATRSTTKPAPRPRKTTAAPSRKAGGVTQRAPRRWTPPEVFEPLIVATLEEYGGELEADELFLALELRAAERLLPGDQETTPQGEPRWQHAARRARLSLIAQGTMTKSRPGVWQLTDTDPQVG